ncbi:uncharacterized protein A4U43_C01F6580 [Asparagus officinalis]|uniref:Transcription factor IIIC subunit Tfc1/Sfc1 triple barrel domain-containing protein n=1 Tax=Asparagus officinalis TaxID=4686 RepID=A0A5P1FR43_ASPOF|nr:uncharacterized protein A4U43_C01F6580 [Asparagus officinalis]
MQNACSPEMKFLTLTENAGPSNILRLRIQSQMNIRSLMIQVRSSDSGQLELRFRPEDPHCHPAFGERRSFVGLVLKISKTRPESDNDGKEQLSAEVVARVNEAYDFEGMVDYQHVLAVHAAEARRKRGRCDIDEETDLGDASRMHLEEEADDVMMLVPPLFSLKNTPEEIVLNPPSNLFSKKLQKSVVEHRWEVQLSGSCS